MAFLKKFNTVFIGVFLVSILCFARVEVFGQERFIHLKNNQLTNGNNQPVKLNSVDLGGWLLWEGWLWGGGFNKESLIKDRLLQLLGQERYVDFVKRYYDTFITEKDIALVAKNGFNSIRLPFNYRIFGNDYKSFINGFEKIDQLIGWCKKYNVYVVLDMHAAPGGQSPWFIADPESEKLQNSAMQQQRTYELWAKIAEHYKNEPTIAGYDILNEPDMNTNTLLSIYTNIIKSIRKADNNHLIIVEGNKLAHNFNGFPAKMDNNQIYSYHYYAWFNERNKLKALHDITGNIKTDLPLWCGEWGEDSPENLKEIRAIFDNEPNLCGTGFWTWKRVYKNNNRHPYYTIATTQNWDKIVKWLNFPVVKPNQEQVNKGVEEFLNAIKVENCGFSAQ